MHGQAPLLSPTHLLHRLATRHVHDHDRDADDLGMADRTVCRLSLDDLRPRSPVKIRRDMPFALKAVGEVADGVVPLTMHHHKCLLAASHFENFEQLPIAQNQVVIGHEHLEGRVAVLDERGQFLTENDRRRIRYNEMKRRVDVAFTLGEFPILLDAGAQR